MSTITAILTPEADGTVHLPIPQDMRDTDVQVTATIERVLTPAQVAEREKRLDAAIQRLVELGTFKSITDPVAWQREIREDRPLFPDEP